MEKLDLLKKATSCFNEDREKLSYYVIKERDIHGGLNFEEEIREVIYNNKEWIIYTYTEQTIQPDLGPTISKIFNESEASYTTEEFASLLEKSQFLTKIEIEEVLNKLLSKV